MPVLCVDTKHKTGVRVCGCININKDLNFNKLKIRNMLFFNFFGKKELILSETRSALKFNQQKTELSFN